ncbi:lysosomal protective protein-like, partial [Amia ocellicauda]|uniref:lysosomal protective protein-like n=1 Tax=Amia ocellicauda TaxID=2972642 RepID=UPI003464DD94
WGQNSADQVTSLPGLSEIPNFQHYSGYLQAGPGKYFHYWFVESQNNPSTDPLILWLNGGPGCSSMDGMLAENGPFHLNDDGTVYINKYSWNTMANVIYLESPAGVGFSYSTSQNYQTSDPQVADDNYQALLDFFSKYPFFASNDFYVFAESYGGIYAPTLTQKIASSSNNINLKGMGVGNGMSSYALNDQSLIYFGYYHGLFGDRDAAGTIVCLSGHSLGSSSEYWEWRLPVQGLNPCCSGHQTIMGAYLQVAWAPISRRASQKVFLFVCSLWTELNQYCCSGGSCNFYSSTDGTCQNAVYQALYVIQDIGLNIYNLYSQCYGGTGISGRYAADVSNLFRNYNFNFQAPVEASIPGAPRCINATAMYYWLNSPDVRTALHIPSFVQSWELCSSTVSSLYQRTYHDMTSFYQYLLQKDLQLLVYNGDVDMACNFIGGKWFVESLNQQPISQYKPWYYNDQIAGYVEQYQKITFLTVMGSGHMVPQYKPGPALQMFQNFLSNSY